MSTALGDLRFAIRALAASPVFVALAVLCLGLGIGASTMTFTAVRAMLVEPLGPIDPDGLVAIGTAHRSAPDEWWPSSWVNLDDWQAAIGERARLAGVRQTSFSVEPGGADPRVEGAYVSPDLFGVLGVAPLLGRGFDARDAAAGAAPVAVLSENYWRRQLAGDATILGRTISLDGVRHAVVGIAPRLLDLGLPVAIRSARVWVPARVDTQPLARADRSVAVFARVGAGISVDSFTAQLEGVAAELAATHRENEGWTVRVAAFGRAPADRTRSLLALSIGAAVLVLLIACANVANLTLAHAVRRRHEFGIRAAIGAAPYRLARQLLCESFAVAALGALLGVGLARIGLDSLVHYYEADTLAPVALPLDWVALVFAVGVVLVATVLVGLTPALEAARGAARARIAESGSGSTIARGQERLRRGLVVGQVAASLALLIGAALLARSFMNMLAVDGGVDAESVTSVRAEVLDAPAGTDAATRYVASMRAALAALPGVEVTAASANWLPLRGGGLRSRVARRTDTDASAGPVVAYTGVTPSFFDTLGIPLQRGRGLTEDRHDGNVAVINERMAASLWPGLDPLGREFRLDADPERAWVTVIGVTRNVLTWDSSGDRPLPTAYFDLASFDSYPVFFFVRQRPGLSADTGTITHAIESVGVPVRRIVVTPMAQVARDPFWRQQLFSLWFNVFGGAAALLTATGLYGVLAFLVSQRWREFGIRIALGASRSDVLMLVLRQGATSVGIGIVIGLVIAAGAVRAMRGWLFGVEPLDATVFALVTASLIAVALAASAAPALRAARADPNQLLKAHNAGR